MQALDPLQVVPQEPQFAGSSRVLTQWPLHSVRPEAQAQRPEQT